ncbi:unnamed protein product [Phytomonas sp. EM1]|nr:unnamed protein product [Phytomonas sp. EM1]|eukprot:CCW64999.1 unnamed protein product [Phytomonas sp. isolate EM1]
MDLFTRLYGDACVLEGLLMNPDILQRVTNAFRRAEASTPPDGEGGLLLELRFDRLTCDGVDWEAAAAALPFLALRSLTFEDSYLGDRGLRVICRVLSTRVLHSSIAIVGEIPIRPAPRWLRSLVLKHTSLKDATPLMDVLAACPQLSFLDVSWNRLGVCVEGFVVFCRALCVHPRLTGVDLSGNLLEGCRGSRVVRALSELLVCCGRPESSLRALYLQENQLGEYFLYSRTLMESREKVWGDGSPADSGGGTAFGSLDEDPYFLNFRKTGSIQGESTSFAPSCMLLSEHPFMEALFLNNTIEELRLEGNGIPEGLLVWIEAKLRVNRRTRQQYMQQFSAQKKDEHPITLGA